MLLKEKAQLEATTGEFDRAFGALQDARALDELAERLVRRFRFRPAVRGGRPVPARIPWTYKFRLEG